MKTLNQHRATSVTAKTNLYMYLSGMLSDYKLCQTHDPKTAEEILKEIKEILNDAAEETHLKMIGEK